MLKLINSFVPFFLIFITNFKIESIAASELKQKPRLSIISSIYNGDEFIEDFLDNITKQTIFENCELILINANSPGNEEKIINKYLSKFSNIIYFKLPKDPGIYAVWNRGIKIASADLICNANIDDRSNTDGLEKHVIELESNPNIDLVYSSFYISYNPNKTFKNASEFLLALIPEFTPKLMNRCLPGPRPVWRKNMHDRFGYFDESFTSSGDLEMWNRAVSMGSEFKKIEGLHSIFYLNPKGISTDSDEQKFLQRDKENDRIKEKYGYFWE